MLSSTTSNAYPRRTYTILAVVLKVTKLVIFSFHPCPDFQYELAEVVTGTKPLSDASDLESLMVGQFQQPDPQRKWREGKLKSSFNYLLLDPRVTRDLPSR